MKGEASISLNEHAGKLLTHSFWSHADRLYVNAYRHANGNIAELDIGLATPREIEFEPDWLDGGRVNSNSDSRFDEFVVFIWIARNGVIFHFWRTIISIHSVVALE